MLDRAAHHDARARRTVILFGAVLLYAHLAVLHAATFASPADMQSWRGTVGWLRKRFGEIVAGWFPAATIRMRTRWPTPSMTLRRGEVDAVFDDDVTLRQYCGEALGLTQLPDSDQYFAVAMALGQPHATQHRRSRDPRAAPRRSGEIPDAFNRKTVAHVGREEEAKADDRRDVPEMDRSVARIRRRGMLRVGVHPGVPSLCVEVANAPRPSQRYAGLRTGHRAPRRAAHLRRPDRVTFVR